MFPFHKKKSVQLAVFFGAILLLQLYLYYSLSSVRRLVDESAHVDQIINFIENKWEVIPQLTTIPGYHFCQAMISKVTGLHSDSYFRFINAFFSFCCIVVFYLNTKVQSNRNRLLYTSIFCTFPLFYPFFYLVYTDTLALLMILLAYHFQKRNKYLVAGLFLIFACLIRQNNIVWGFYFVATAIYDQYKQEKPISKIILSLSTYALCLVLFIIFYKMNGGVAIGDRWAHPSMQFRSENTFFFLFIFFILLLPYVIESLTKLTSTSLLQIAGLLLLLAASIGLYWFTYKADHPYNVYFPETFIRNGFIKYFQQDVVHKWLFLIMALLALIPLYLHTLEKPSLIILMLTIVLCLIPTWMIETRYYFIPFALFLLIPKKESQITLWSQLALNLILLFFLSEKVPADIFFP